jgi:hypothetical protein
VIFNLDFGTGASGQDQIEYSGQKLYAQSGRDWDAALLSSGTLRVKTSALVDLFIVAGGKPGSRGSGDAIGGQGGAGGECVLVSSVRLRRGVSYTVTIGDSGEDSSIVGDSLVETAESGKGSAGGVGAIVSGTSRTRSAQAGTDGVFAFGVATSLIESLSGRKYGAGGGGGEAFNSSYVYSNSWQHSGSNSGGVTGGGTGGVTSSGGDTNATSGAANTGAGGGGSWRKYSGDSVPGNGGSGILLIRYRAQ